MTQSFIWRLHGVCQLSHGFERASLEGRCSMVYKFKTLFRSLHRTVGLLNKTSIRGRSYWVVCSVALALQYHLETARVHGAAVDQRIFGRTEFPLLISIAKSIPLLFPVRFEGNTFKYFICKHFITLELTQFVYLFTSTTSTADCGSTD